MHSIARHKNQAQSKGPGTVPHVWRWFGEIGQICLSTSPSLQCADNRKLDYTISVYSLLFPVSRYVYLYYSENLPNVFITCLLFSVNKWTKSYCIWFDAPAQHMQQMNPFAATRGYKTWCGLLPNTF